MFENRDLQIALRQTLAYILSKAEFQAVCFALGAEVSAKLSDTSQEARALELVELCERHQALRMLVHAVQTTRPGIRLDVADPPQSRQVVRLNTCIMVENPATVPSENLDFVDLMEADGRCTRLRVRGFVRSEHWALLLREGGEGWWNKILVVTE
jgi:hypothetical protein